MKNAQKHMPKNVDTIEWNEWKYTMHFWLLFFILDSKIYIVSAARIIMNSFNVHTLHNQLRAAFLLCVFNGC